MGNPSTIGFHHAFRTARTNGCKLSAWFLLMILSYTMVAALHGVVAYRGRVDAVSETGVKRQAV
ncbi:MAG: hypothetical protein JXQ99_29660 [Hyphomicrobiaceae bacterium]